MNTGGPAFPIRSTESRLYTGMTLRDWFAGQAMQGLIASPRGPASGEDATDEWVAKTAYVVADAMLSQREKS
jgi:hypothetical protein